MQYLGGKARISKRLSLFINNLLLPEQPFVDLFCGSCNIIAKIDNNRLRIANDIHPYLIAMWKQVQNDWTPPSVVTEEMYKDIRSNKDRDKALSGFVGFGCSFAGKWFGGYARSKALNRSRAINAKNGLLKKKPGIIDVEFLNKNYSDVTIPQGSLVYCDIPYRGTTGYKFGDFNHDEFYNFVINNTKDGTEFIISEYKHNVRDDFEIIWFCESSQEIRNKQNKRNKTVETLSIYKHRPKNYRDQRLVYGPLFKGIE
jgi:DNA adenine methylase